MTHHPWKALLRRALELILFLTLLPATTQAQEQPSDGWQLLDASVAHHHLSSGYAPWQEAALRGMYRQGDHLWGVDLLHADRFSEKGVYAGLQDTVRLAPDWHASLGYGLGTEVNWLPRYRLDGFVHHNWGQQGNWVTHFGLGEYKSHDDHRDRWGSIGLSAYLSHPDLGPWAIDGQLRWTRSDPGSITTRQQFLALTWGHRGADRITWRHGWGREGWQAIGDAQSLANFASRQDTLTWQRWVGPDWGFRLMADHYRNDQYRRTGLTFGIFKEFP